ncbi:maleylpyruvate isomerase family mycothiol-dependent enzyme [Ornithinimicrobium murale]|uniref:maleylpyruvate isomerase family mycothiol-dependent enzyme n=1 Tax=Ornithinimicrobium murale TaxID=1050153 RepID=UPI000E0CF65C|nr:maleylpyruvate isomerase family mycothiol-dependent enzyme [Ornithinimicrobium murale]
MTARPHPRDHDPTLSTSALWSAIHTERAALASDLADISAEEWSTPSLCAEWTVEEVVAHLTAAASTARLAWVRSIVAARFRPAVHNQRRLVEHLGTSPTQTLERFQAVVTSTVAPSGHTAAWLGEVIVHGEDVRRPLGIVRTPPTRTTAAVAHFFARQDFAVNSRSAVKGLRLEASDGPFAVGTGPLVTGSTLALVLAMAGRASAYEELTGPGVAELVERAQPA